MKLVKESTPWIALAAAGLFVAGCQSGGDRATAEIASTQAVTCDKCKVTYVRVPAHRGKSRTIGYRSVKRMECPECRTAAENFFSTGKFQHTCKICGDSMEICDAH